MTAVARVGMAQMLVEGGQPDRNMTAAVDMIWRAARAGCGIVVLPECLDLGWTHPSAATQACPIPGPRTEALAAAARECAVYVAAGLTERSDERLHNAAVLISPEGRLLLHHRKINELNGNPFFFVHQVSPPRECLFSHKGEFARSLGDPPLTGTPVRRLTPPRLTGCGQDEQKYGNGWENLFHWHLTAGARNPRISGEWDHVKQQAMS